MWAYEAHARLLLNQKLSSGARGDVQQLVAAHVNALTRASLVDSLAEGARIAARVALAQGHVAAACRGLTASSALFEQCGASDHAARNRYALGAITGGEPGAEMQRAALVQLREQGLVAPERDLKGYYPELIRNEPR